jgi:acyl-CoA thioesterase YciA
MVDSTREPAIRVMATVADTNAGGDIFGGWIMSQVDIAGSIPAHRLAKGRVVTVAVNSFQFHEPVYVGDVVSCYAVIEKIGRTSITVFVEVFAEREHDDQVLNIKVTEATLTYVAVDKNGRPRPVRAGANTTAQE